MKKDKNGWVRLSVPRLKPLRDQEMNEAQRKLLDPFKKIGRIPNSLSTMARSPRMMSRWLLFAAYIVRGTALPPRERELLILRTTRLCGSEYEFAQHAMVAETVGISKNEISRIMDQDENGWNASESVLLRVADELYSSTFISGPTWDALAGYYNEEQIIDTIMIVGQYILLSLFTNALGVPLDRNVPKITK